MLSVSASREMAIMCRLLRRKDLAISRSLAASREATVLETSALGSSRRPKPVMPLVLILVRVLRLWWDTAMD